MPVFSSSRNKHKHKHTRHYYQDYRTEEISQLTKSGKSMEEIRARFIPETTNERREKVKQSRMTMQELVADVATLKKEVVYLKTRLDENKGDDAASSTSRRNEEEQHPGDKSLDKIRFEEEEPLASEKTKVAANLRGSEEQTPVTGNKVTQESMSSKHIEDKGSVPEGDLLGSP
jgi:hypothetical protein